MKQVLLAESGHPSRSRSRSTTPPILMWMGDDILPGDAFTWGGRTYFVSSIYTTAFSCGACRRTEYPRSHQQSGVVIDQRGGESTGVPGIGSGSGTGTGDSSH